MSMRLFGLVYLLLFSASAALADAGPLGFGEAELKRDMQTDRPDFTEGTLTVEPGHIQVEAGYTYLRDTENGIDGDVHDLPEILLRIGLSERTEFRFFWEGYIHEEVEGGREGKDTHDGVSDISLGFKHTMGYQDGMIPEYGIIAELGVPTGSEEFTNDKVQPLVKLLWAYEIDERLGIAGNFNFDFPVVDDDRFLELSNAVSVAYTLTNDIGAYIEYFGFYPDDTKITTTRHFVNGGFTYLVNPNLQFDIRAGFGLNDAAEDVFSGGGLTFRM